jgi:hypothetical protein
MGRKKSLTFEGWGSHDARTSRGMLLRGQLEGETLVKEETLLGAWPSESTGEPARIAVLWQNSGTDWISKSAALDLHSNLLSAGRTEEARLIETGIRLFNSPP